MIKDFHIPTDSQDAVNLKQTHPEAVYLAGGTQVNRAPLERKLPSAVIDIRGVVPARIYKEGENLIIGSMASLQDLVESPLVPEPLAQAAGFIPTRSLRNQATIAGNIAAARSDSYLIPVLIALSAETRIFGGELLVEDYVRNHHDELILEILIPPLQGICVAVKESRSHLAYPVVSAAVSLSFDTSKRKISAACIAVGCVAKTTIRLAQVEEDIVSGKLRQRSDIEKAIRIAINPEDDILGSAEYKKYINGVVIADAVISAQGALK